MWHVSAQKTIHNQLGCPGRPAGDDALGGAMEVADAKCRLKQVLQTDGGVHHLSFENP